MNILFPVLVAGLAFGVALRVYPRWIARVFKEDDRVAPPSVRRADDRDFVESRYHVVFAQHFAAIAGAGPIVGPTLALAFGWQPVWLWIVLGGIFFGAVHDMSSLFVSVREGGSTIVGIARRTLGPTGYVLNLIVLIFVLTVVNAIFLNLSVIALTSVYPLEALRLAPDQTLLHVTLDGGIPNAHIGGIATTSVLIITAFAPVLGYFIRRRHLPTSYAYLVAVIVCVSSVIVGFKLPVRLDGETWRYLMTFYVFAACALPVWLILQPREFTNVQILYGGIALVVASALVSGVFHGVSIQAPAVDLATGEAALKAGIWPILFITVACGAISGFHSLVATGTTVRQVARESDCRRIGYGAMILESLLAVVVLMAVASMLTQREYLDIVYPSDRPSNPLLGFALGTGRLVNDAWPFVPVAVAVVLGILMVEGFVVTTLDTAVRLCRYLIEEFWAFTLGERTPALLRQPVVNTAIAVGSMLFFALSSTVRQMWPVFGAGNQLIGSLALITVTVWLVQRARAHLFALLPAAFMAATTLAALVILVRNNFGVDGNRVLGATAGVLFFLAVGVLVVGVTRFAQAIHARAAGRTIEMESV
jgi:carbon starvation protein